jgi:hypothetical protein
LSRVANRLVDIFRVGTVVIDGAAAVGDRDTVAPTSVNDLGVLIRHGAFRLGAPAGHVGRVAISCQLRLAGAPMRIRLLRAATAPTEGHPIAAAVLHEVACTDLFLRVADPFPIAARSAAGADAAAVKTRAVAGASSRGVTVPIAIRSAGTATDFTVAVPISRHCAPRGGRTPGRGGA